MSENPFDFQRQYDPMADLPELYNPIPRPMPFDTVDILSELNSPIIAQPCSNQWGFKFLRGCSDDSSNIKDAADTPAPQNRLQCSLIPTSCWLSCWGPGVFSGLEVPVGSLTGAQTKNRIRPSPLGVRHLEFNADLRCDVTHAYHTITNVG